MKWYTRRDGGTFEREGDPRGGGLQQIFFSVSKKEEAGKKMRLTEKGSGCR